MSARADDIQLLPAELVRLDCRAVAAAVIELPGYTEQEKLVIAEQYLLKRRFDEPGESWRVPLHGEVLGEGEVDALPAAVREAIARERRRLGNSSGADTATSNDWIEWLEGLPWTRRAEAPVDLAQVRAALDAGHAGLDHAKACIIEHLAVRRRNPRSPAVLCLAGAPGVGKTSLAHCVAESLGRGFIRLSCGGLRDETDLRGHNRTWRDAQPGWILREMRRVGSRNPVFVLDELDKVGAAPAAVLLEVLDPAQHDRFRDAFVELPFDLSEVLFITTANEPARILPALRDRLEVIELPGYTQDKKVAIAHTHLIEAQNRAAGLAAAPVRFTPGACRRIIRDYTSEPGVRQLARCLQAICRKVALGLEARASATGSPSVRSARFSASRAPATATGLRACGRSSRRRHCLLPCGTGGKRCSRGCRRGRRPIPTMPAPASTWSAW